MIAPLPDALDRSWSLTVRRRRLLFALLVGLTVAAAVFVMARILLGDGLNLFEAGILGCFVMTIPWIAIGFWNSVIGVILALGGRGVEKTSPFMSRVDRTAPIRTRTALIMPIYNEDPARVFEHIERILGSLDETGESRHFEFFLLSDTNKPEIAAEEERRFAELSARDPRPGRLHYRRRPDNVGQKAGNVRDFCERWGERFDFMIVLDADSIMTGGSLLNLVRTMQANPRLGILQTLIAGLPARSAFARIFQFGMRQGMRTYTMGSAWWLGEDGPYWGHNAIIRVAPFIAHCDLPVLPGRAPLGGRILSHDQVEAAMIRRGGYEVRVLPAETGSYEENPPTILDFIKRDLRWCQGNMQYFKLLRTPGLLPMGRLQLILAILMYASSLFWLGFLTLSLGQAVVFGLGADPGEIAPLVGTYWGSIDAGAGLAFFVVMLGMTFTPKFLGVIEIMSQRTKRRSYGGSLRLLTSALVEFVFSVLIAPILAVVHSIFIIGLMFGRCVTWEAQDRDGHQIGLREAVSAFWPQTLAGLGWTGALALTAPSVLPFASPILIPLTFAVPFALITSRMDFGRLLARVQLCPMPEELMQSKRIVFGQARPSLAGTGVEGVPIVAETSRQAPAAALVRTQEQTADGRWI